jgi:23S rRNA (cytosine1962-C5)-methyltransferase
MELFSPTDWTDYELIDTGNREKLERFGKYILIRPEPQAVWKKAMSEEDWDKLHHARFSRGKSGTTSPHYQSPVTSHDAQFTKERKEERGEWIRKPEMPDQWMIGYRYKEMQLKFRLGLTAFGHIGVFPEQAENWKFVYDTIQAISHEAHGTRDELRGTRDEVRNANRSEAELGGAKRETRVLNLFAYTGGASLAAKAAGADVVHVDSVKQVINWAREDMEVSNLDGIRWVIEDALKFVRREVKRGNHYDGIILDPPAYGRGPDGEKWILEDSINEMIAHCAKLLIPHSSFLILSLYSMGFSSLIGESLVKSHFGTEREIQTGEFYFTDRAGRRLPLGTVTRFY